MTLPLVMPSYVVALTLLGAGGTRGVVTGQTGRGFFTYGPDRERTDRLPDDRQRLG